MSTPSIDYAALASQARGGTDYAALAQQARGNDQGFLSSFGDTSGISGIASLALGALTHPIDTALGLASGVKAQVKEAGQNIADAYQGAKSGSPDEAQRIALAVPIAGPIAKKMADQATSGNTAGAVGTYLGAGAGVALSKLFPKAVAATPDGAAAIAKTAQTVGDASEAAGSKLVNETVGAYKSDFNRGANPGRGYLNNKLGVSLSMRSLANKAEEAQQTIGRSIQRTIAGSTAANTIIPANDVIEALGKPLKDAYDAETAPGGMGNTGAYEQYAQGFKDTIQKGINKGGFTPQEVFDLKKQIASKAKFNAQTPEGILDVRQSQVGALGGLLTKVMPELAPLNQSYQDLVKLSDRAQWRAESGAIGIRGLIKEGAKGTAAIATSAVGGAHEGLGVLAGLSALDSTAGRTAAATALYNGGRGMSAVGSRLEQYLRSR